ncbi:hypothetical protein [Micromonospora sp. NPDC048839]
MPSRPSSNSRSSWRQGRTPAGDPTFVGITNGRRHVQLLYDVEVYSDTAG